ncbi:lysylphosphatidylglycerol synthase transmembrane domain-containing protein [Hymenobacter cheonanensis]|uniref:lysylphosphatidylglycerol synthase transmembrane domain-containing protein n=1 Tax=Hymenobacter sp. CA2-7 TaxID=3063993 RepID=UPI002713DCE3|nr:lysylphosphatidylglycerol synthase transmembrane domain-containing protein [Hymenobacter sp. CA2-7]MDO7887659.1 lysylphosphatidylglycerol synthase transmembrane domain-containing protein [Hymenobacter sp. CA2-7]
MRASHDDEAAPAPAAPAAWRRYLTLLVKLAFMAAALWLVARHLDLPALGRTLRQARPGWLALAAVLFTVSKLISSVRLNTFFRAVGIQLTERYNLRLYWLGMFYNLFLPGGIGGDGYKVYLLGKEFPGRRGLIFRALLLDRLSGMVALLVLLLALLAVVPAAELRAAGALALPTWWRAVPLALMPVGLAASYGLGRWGFGEFRSAFGRTSWEALGVQGAQVLCAWALLAALGAAGGPVLPYLLVFLASSIAAVLPLTVGGLGARELTFLYGAQLFALSGPVAVSVSVLFYVITALVSLVGALVRVGRG